MKLSEKSLVRLLQEVKDRGPYPGATDYKPDEEDLAKSGLKWNPDKGRIEELPPERHVVQPPSDPEGKQWWESLSANERTELMSKWQTPHDEVYNKRLADFQKKQQQDWERGDSADDLRRQYMQQDIDDMIAKNRALSTGEPGSRERRAAMDAYRSKEMRQKYGWPEPKEEKPLPPIQELSPEEKAARQAARDKQQQDILAMNQQIKDLIGSLMTDPEFKGKWESGEWTEGKVRGMLRAQKPDMATRTDITLPADDAAKKALVDQMFSLHGGQRVVKDASGKDQTIDVAGTSMQAKAIAQAKIWGLDKQFTPEQLRSLTPNELNALIKQAKEGKGIGGGAGDKGGKGGANQPTASITKPASPPLTPPSPTSAKPSTPSPTATASNIKPTSPSSTSAKPSTPSPTATASAIISGSNRRTGGSLGSPVSIGAPIPTTMASAQTTETKQKVAGVQPIAAPTPSSGANAVLAAANQSSKESGSSQSGSVQVASGAGQGRLMQTARGAKRAVGVAGSKGYESQITNIAPTLAESVRFKKNELKMLMEELTTAAKQTLSPGSDLDTLGSENFIGALGTVGNIATNVLSYPLKAAFTPPHMRLPFTATDYGYTPTNAKRIVNYYRDNPFLAGTLLATLAKTNIGKGYNFAKTGLSKILSAAVAKSAGSKIGSAVSGAAGKLGAAGAVMDKFLGNIKLDDEALNSKIGREMGASLVDVRLRGAELPYKEKQDPIEVRYVP